MKFEVLKKNNLKRNIVIGVFVVLIISAIILNFSSARYRSTASVPIVDSEVNYVRPDLNIVAIVVDGVSTNTMPEGNYKLLDTSYCTANGEDANVTLSWDQTAQALSVTPFTTRGTKCYLDFVTATTKEVDTVLGTIEVNLDTPDFSKTAQASCSDTSTCEETNGIYEETTSKGTTYYWRGAVDNNWVRWAGFYWRIIRINEDGTIRMIYQGTSANTTGTATQTQTRAFNSSWNDNMYVGYMYQSNQPHGLTSDSTILTALNSWYSSNLASYADDIDTNAGFCNDRQPSTSTSSSNGSGGTGTTITFYGAYIRLETNKAPTFECQNSSDLFTVSSSNKGNKALQYPIGLITADEVSYAGGVVGSTNSSYYLYTNSAYWTMSPFTYGFYGTTAFVFRVDSSGWLINTYVYKSSIGVRPVINLKATTTISSGNGTAQNPFIVD